MTTTTTTSAFFPPFLSVSQACRSIWNKRTRKGDSSAVTVTLLQGSTGAIEEDIKLAGLSLDPASPPSESPPFLRRLLHGRRTPSKTMTGLDPELERGYKAMLLLEGKYGLKFSIPRRVRRKLAPFVQKELAADIERSTVEAAYWLAASQDKAKVPGISMINSIPQVDAGPLTHFFSYTPSLPLPISTEQAVIANEPPGKSMEITTTEQSQELNQEHQPPQVKSKSTYVYALPNIKTRRLISLFLSTRVKTDLPWSRSHIIYPHRDAYELPPGMKGSKTSITSSLRVWKANRDRRRHACQKFGFTITRFLTMPALKAIPEVDEVCVA